MKRKYYVHVKWNSGGIWMRLYNFPVNRWELQLEHKRWIDDVALPFLREDSARTVFLVGMTSRTGKEANNVILSKRRANEVYDYFDRNSLGSRLDERLGGIKAGGESYAKTKGHPDNKEDEYFRAVDIWLLKNLFSDPAAPPIPDVPILNTRDFA